MKEKESMKSFGELPTWGRPEPKEPEAAEVGPSWSEREMSEAETLRRPEGIRDDGRTDASRRWKAGEEILGRYVVEKDLGQGGMGVVYGCLDKVGGVRVAVKCLPPELSHNIVEMEEVRENYQLVYGLSHPNIAGVRQLERDERGEYYLVMEEAVGENLRRWLRAKWKSGGVSLAEAVGVLKQVASALDYAHGEKVVHRDVKPGNVMIDGRGRVKVMDFGLAAQIRTSLSRASHASGGTSGTGPYMAPEQWRGRRQDGKTDQYALGVMAYEMLAGYLPFENDEMSVLREVVLKEEPEAIPGVPEGSMEAIRRAMAKATAERFANCVAFVDALESAASQGGASTPCEPVKGTAAGAAAGNPDGKPARTTAERTARPEGSPHQGARAGERMTVRVGAQEVALRWCPAGTFTMGSPDGEEGRFDYETQHQVMLIQGFWMGETEVTQGLWREVMKDNPSFFKRGDNYPVEKVSWEDCQRFVQVLNSRYPQEGMRWALPTEAQWEYACRAGTETAYFWGNALNGDKANCDGNYPCGTTVKGPYKEKTTPVGSYETNEWGLYDMHGNVYEWCADWYGPYPSSLVTDPTGPREGSNRVYRGGSWNSSARGCRSAYRGWARLGRPDLDLGLRVALLPVQ